MFSEQRPAMENAYQTLQASHGNEPSFAGLVRAGLKHLADRARDFDVCVDCDSAQSKHFFSELASLKGDSGTFISDVLLAWLDPRARKEYLKG